MKWKEHFKQNCCTIKNKQKVHHLNGKALPWQGNVQAGMPVGTPLVTSTSLDE